ncbi:PepSY domain-containing protein [Allorhizobium sp. BGMRC 0089]|uniref:PepSY domain-containing protein n=1 Tax=Allorhizobium sonneratiae TaxID=2934936 RepID=UPI0020334D07|nr:PepSY domain-containing protein [Allorhizobium sonneratiae]MCM2293876.1 PepSY domain-containing protein [Allorhizobium sonneratiae]
MHKLHSLAGLIAGLVLCVIALSGTWLAIDNALASFSAPSISQNETIGQLAAKLSADLPGLSDITRHPDGTLTASYSGQSGYGMVRVDPASGKVLGPFTVSPLLRKIISLHRALFMGDRGRIGTAVADGMMLALCLSGLVLLKRRAGGWRRVLLPVRGSGMSVLHGTLGQMAILGLVLSSLTGLWLTASSFGFLPEPPMPAFVEASPGPRMGVADIAVLDETPLTELKKLTFPAPTDPTDIYDLKTTSGEAMIDPVTGKVLSSVKATWVERVGDVIMAIHTGRGLAVLGLLLGLAAMSVPVFTLSGALIWFRRRAMRPKIAENVAVKKAHIVILVGSEGNTTWGFARTLHKALTLAGARVHVAAMNEVKEAHLGAELLFLLTSTAGDGQAPASANAFLSRIERLSGRPAVAILGFGDKTFGHFCGFAETVEQKLRQLDWPMIMPMTTIDRQSSQAFAQWGVALSRLLKADIVLDHVASAPKTREFELVARHICGTATGAPIAVLRFKPAPGRFWQGSLDRFGPGDLIGVLPPGTTTPRFYSLATEKAHGFIEICVRLHENGLCSGFLHSLQPGDRIDAFLRPNPAFRPQQGKSPVILIGAGTGIAALAGLVRSNVEGRPLHLYWGGRRPDDDFPYRDELIHHMRERRLASLRTAFSRVQTGAAYVQDRIEDDSDHLRHLLHNGAQIVVCGGRDMAQAVAKTLDRILHPLGMTTEQLKSTGRYVEDVY